MQKPKDLIGVLFIPTPLPTRARSSNYLKIIQQFRESNIKSAVVTVKDKNYSTIYAGLKSAIYQYQIKDIRAHTRDQSVYLTRNIENIVGETQQ
jgi:hypothetical protein